MKWIGGLLGAIVLLAVILCVVAFLLPAHTQHTRGIELHQTPEAIFAVLADVDKLPEWNRNLQKVEILSAADGKETTRQTFKTGMTMTVVTSDSLAPTHLVREIQDNGAPFSGSWTYDITPTSDGSKVALTEKSEIKNPFFRLMVALFGPTKYLDENLADLAKRFGETAKIR